eukprot:CAMPEP_0197846258 /NCGR_PEP_ID=MMETSP1438-20131217/3029_1 /TAXON_ID=1461541 /ORGANISM="Pterosperma sp., Strain CCMP1384" /LENGTH=579 /DNA_ID=CAMNT_0043457835 /DNA_START=360 /DNA_END=2099 /DNA_ORIENTATION=-
MSTAEVFELFDKERRQRALAESQLEDSRARCNALATENSRLSTVCNELTFRCVLHNVDVPHQTLSQDQANGFPKRFDFSSREVEYADHTCSSRFWGDETRFEQAMPGPGRRVFTDASIGGLCDFGPSMGVEHLDLSGCHITDAGIARLCKGLPKLRQLDLSGCTSISDSSAPLIRQNLQALEVLDLSGTQVGNEGIAEIAKLGSLRELRLRGCKGINDKGCTLLTENLHKDSFIALDMSGTGITDEGVLKLVSKLPKLVSLGLACCEITDASIQAIANLKGLRNLNLAKCEAITEEGVSALKKCTSLTALDLSKTSCTAGGLTALSTLSEMKRLSLGSSGGLLQPELPSASPLAKLSASMPSLPQAAVTEASPRHLQQQRFSVRRRSVEDKYAERDPSLAARVNPGILPAAAPQPEMTMIPQQQGVGAQPLQDVRTAQHPNTHPHPQAHPYPMQRTYEAHRPYEHRSTGYEQQLPHHRVLPRAKPMQLRRTVIAGFARRNLVPCDEPEAHLRELQDRRATAKYNAHTRRAHHSDPSVHGLQSKQHFNEADCKTQISKSSLVAKLRNSLEQDMTFRTMES